MGRKPLTEYLRVDGLNKMLADLNFGQDFAIQRAGVDQVTYATAGDLWDFLANLRIRGALRIDGSISWQAIANQDLYITNSQSFMVYDGAAYQDVLQFIRAAVPYVNIPRAGNISLLAGKYLDLLAAKFYPKQVSQDLIPTPDVNELLIWRRAADGKVRIVYNDFFEGVKSVELT